VSQFAYGTKILVTPGLNQCFLKALSAMYSGFAVFTLLIHFSDVLYPIIQIAYSCYLTIIYNCFYMLLLFFFSFFNHQQFSEVAVQAPLYPQFHFAKHNTKKIAFVKKFNVLN